MRQETANPLSKAISSIRYGCSQIGIDLANDLRFIKHEDPTIGRNFSTYGYNVDYWPNATISDRMRPVRESSILTWDTHKGTLETCSYLYRLKGEPAKQIEVFLHAWHHDLGSGRFDYYINRDAKVTAYHAFDRLLAGPREFTWHHRMKRAMPMSALDSSLSNSPLRLMNADDLLYIISLDICLSVSAGVIVETWPLPLRNSEAAPGPEPA